MKIKFNNSYIHVRGRVRKEHIEEATIIFMRKVIKEKNQNGNKHKTGDIKEKSILD